MIDYNQWSEIRKVVPLVHQITNPVTVNGCANITLACGGSPLMADAIEEVEDIVSKSQALTLNIGTVTLPLWETMQKAGKTANRLGIPVVLDPVGVGASRFRQKVINGLLEEIDFAVIRGNASEIATICGEVSGKGVDSEQLEVEEYRKLYRTFAEENNVVLSVSGPIDYVTDGEREAWIENGVPLLSQVTGTGCMLTAVTGTCLGAGMDPFTAAVLSLGAVGISGEKAAKRLTEKEGTASFQVYFFDEISLLTAEDLKREAKIRIA